MAGSPQCGACKSLSATVNGLCTSCSGGWTTPNYGTVTWQTSNQPLYANVGAAMSTASSMNWGFVDSGDGMGVPYDKHQERIYRAQDEYAKQHASVRKYVEYRENHKEEFVDEMALAG